MKLHWSLSNLIVGTILCGMLGTMQVALAEFHEPFPCWNCCPNGPLCVGEDNVNYRLAHVRLNSGINYIATYMKLPPETTLAQIQTDIGNAISEDWNQWNETASGWIIHNAALLEAPKVNIPELYSLAKASGYTPNNEAAIAAWAANTTQAQRVAFVKTIQAWGLFGLGEYIQNTAKLLTVAPHLPRERVRQLMNNPPQGPCNALADASAITAVYAGALVFIPGGQAASLIAVLIAAILAFIAAAIALNGGC